MTRAGHVRFRLDDARGIEDRLPLCGIRPRESRSVTRHPGHLDPRHALDRKAGDASLVSESSGWIGSRRHDRTRVDEFVSQTIQRASRTVDRHGDDQPPGLVTRRLSAQACATVARIGQVVAGSKQQDRVLTGARHGQGAGMTEGDLEPGALADARARACST